MVMVVAVERLVLVCKDLATTCMDTITLEVEDQVQLRTRRGVTLLEQVYLQVGSCTTAMAVVAQLMVNMVRVVVATSLQQVALVQTEETLIMVEQMVVADLELS